MNNSAAPVEKDILLLNGDVLKFGTEIVRGAGKRSLVFVFHSCWSCLLTINRDVPTSGVTLYLRVV